MRSNALTGLSPGQLLVLTGRVRDAIGDVAKPGGRPPAIGLCRSVVMVVHLMRRNPVQAVAGEIFGVSQATVSRRWDLLRPIIRRVLAVSVPHPPEIIGGSTLLVDGTIAPTWEWKHTGDLYSAKHGTAGMNIQLSTAALPWETPLQEAPAMASVAVGPNGELAPTPLPDGNLVLADVSVPAIVQTRTDLAQPVLLAQTQTDVYGPPNGVLGYGPATQSDSADFRLWEIAGTAHADDCVANVCGSDTGNAASAIVRFDDMLNPPDSLNSFPPCRSAINTGEQGYVMEAALAQLARWVEPAASTVASQRTLPLCTPASTRARGPPPPRNSTPKATSSAASAPRLSTYR